VAPGGTIMAYVSWDRSPYAETLNGKQMPPRERDEWPAFDPADAGTEREFGLLNHFICRHPCVVRSPHPDANMAAIGPRAAELVARHPIGSGYGPESPIERLLDMGGRVLLLGAPLDAVTVLHYAEAVADIPGKRRVTYEMPVLDGQGRKIWVKADEWDSNGILDCFAIEGRPDAVETIARHYVAERPHLSGQVGSAHSYLFEGRDIVAFGKSWLERNFGSGAGV
jgi:aminoglycoside 3-N-acetyltransferase/aminoglycoside 3-N-acetyltransferase-2